MQEMVHWPAPTGWHSDSGEGGLFAWMVVPETASSGEAVEANVFARNCHVDVSAYLSRPRVMLTRPDVCVSAEGRKVFEPYDYDDAWLNRALDLGKLLDEHKGPEDARLRRALIQTMGSDDVSVPMLAAVFLGSTSHSLWDEAAGQYFEVTFAHLTQDGKLLYELWQRVYGVEPVLLTFLDT